MFIYALIADAWKRDKNQTSIIIYFLHKHGELNYDLQCIFSGKRESARKGGGGSE
jgi:hypothetical protein